MRYIEFTTSKTLLRYCVPFHNFKAYSSFRFQAYPVLKTKILYFICSLDGPDNTNQASPTDSFTALYIFDY